MNSGEASYDVNEFWKFEMRVGQVKEAERIPRTRKLIKMIVDFGDSEKTAVVGIGDQYTPEELLDKKLVFVTNLKPKKLSGVLSEAMLIVAEEESGKIHLITLPKNVPNGTKVW